MEREGCADRELVTIVEVYTRGADGGIEHYQMIPREAVSSCVGCAAVYDCPSECDCGRCREGGYGD